MMIFFQVQPVFTPKKLNEREMCLENTTSYLSKFVRIIIQFEINSYFNQRIRKNSYICLIFKDINIYKVNLC